jgi:hypothetical protein
LCVALVAFVPVAAITSIAPATAAPLSPSSSPVLARIEPRAAAIVVLPRSFVHGVIAVSVHAAYIHGPHSIA